MMKYFYNFVKPILQACKFTNVNITLSAVNKVTWFNMEDKLLLLSTFLSDVIGSC